MKRPSLKLDAMKTAIWTVCTLVLLLWTALAWGLWALLTLEPDWIKALHEHLSDTVLGTWLSQHLSGWNHLLTDGLAQIQDLLSGLSRPLSWLIGLLWLVGAAAALLVASVTHAAIVRSESQTRAGPPRA